MDTYTIEQIYQMLMTNTFEMWYDSTFLDHVTGEDSSQPKNQIMEELKVLLD